MIFPFFIAKGYFYTKTHKRLIHYLSIISSLSIALSTMILLLVLSIFNGMEELIHSLFCSFSPTIKIDLKEGKYFTLDDQNIKHIMTIQNVAAVITVLEENVLIAHQRYQMLAKIKGVSENFLTSSPLKAYIQQGSFKFKTGNVDCAIIGKGIQHILELNPLTPLSSIAVFYPRENKIPTHNVHQLYIKKDIFVAATFAIEKKFDDQYIIVPISFLEKLQGITGQLTALELQLNKGASIAKVQRALQQQLPDHFQIRNSKEQNMDLVKAIAIERLLVILIFSFIFFIASLNIFFILSMFVLEKKKDVAILRTMGAKDKDIRNIFLLEGLLISCKGAICGIIMAYFFGILQQHFGIISLGTQTGITTVYPIKMALSDFLYTAVSTVALTLLAAYWPAQRATAIAIKSHI